MSKPPPTDSAAASNPKTSATATTKQYAHNPYGGSGSSGGSRERGQIHTPLQRPRSAPQAPSGSAGGSLSSTPALTGFSPLGTAGQPGPHEAAPASGTPHNPKAAAHSPATASTRSQSIPAASVVAAVLTSPHLASATPRLRFRWDPYGSSLREDSNGTNDGDPGGDGSVDIGITFSPGLGPAPSPNVLPANSSDHSNNPNNASHASLSASVAGGAQQQQRQASSLIFHTGNTPSVGGGSTRTAPLTVEDLLANSPHLAQVSPTGSPGLVSVDKKSLSSTHQNDGRRYYLDFSTVATRPPASMATATPTNRGGGGGGGTPGLSSAGYPNYSGIGRGSNAMTSPGPIGGRRPPVATVRIPTTDLGMMNMGGAGVGGVASTGATPEDLFAEVMPTLQLPDQEHPMSSLAAAVEVGDEGSPMQPAPEEMGMVPSYLPAAYTHLMPMNPAETFGYASQPQPQDLALLLSAQQPQPQPASLSVVAGDDSPQPQSSHGGDEKAARYGEECAILDQITQTPSEFFAKMLPPPPPVPTLLSVCSLQSVFTTCTRYIDFTRALETGEGMSALGGGAGSGDSAMVSSKTSPQSRPRDRAAAASTHRREKEKEATAQVPYAALEAPPPLPTYAVNTTAELEATRRGMLDWYTAAVTWWNGLHGQTTNDATLTGSEKRKDEGSSVSNRERKSGAGKPSENRTLGIDTLSPSVQAAVKAVMSGTVRRGTDFGSGGGGGGGGYRGRNAHTNPSGGHARGGGGYYGGRGGRGRGGGYNRGFHENSHQASSGFSAMSNSYYYGGGGGGGGAHAASHMNPHVMMGVTEGYTFSANAVVPGQHHAYHAASGGSHPGRGGFSQSPFTPYPGGAFGMESAGGREDEGGSGQRHTSQSATGGSGGWGVKEGQWS